MVDKSFLNWPFFEDQHRVLADSLEDWAGKNLTQIDHQNIDGACRQLVTMLGDAGFLAHSIQAVGIVDSLTWFWPLSSATHTDPAPLSIYHY